MQPEKRNKIFVIVGSVVVVALLVFLWILFSSGQKSVVEIFVAPSDAKVTVDGKEIIDNKIQLSKGEHVFAATREHFESVTKTIDTGTLRGDRIVYLALGVNTPEAQAYLGEHIDEQERFERIGSAEVSDTQDKIAAEYPVTAKLPYQTTDYKIDYNVTDDQKVIFDVTLFPVGAAPGSSLYKEKLERYKTQALNYLKSQGVDTFGATITFSPDPASL
ncbi:MAG TPA: hypothetical protein VFB59_04695 [Candidatus Saccharimonadales bacterium]|nr:hypothetical protein [Candidatus Saccharimonadales bacterium]